MSRPAKPVFLERQGYRRRRLADAARMLPVFGAMLLAVPLFWPGPEAGAEAGATPGGGVAMSTAFLYVFGVWLGLIVLSAVFGLRARGWGGPDGPHGPGAR